jgi:dsDNA-specific endonuclease/ATPase MutS2
MHDRVAELAGLRNELAICTNGPRESRRDKADEVQEQIDRVRGELETEVEQLETRAEQLLANGHDGLAGEATEQARTIRETLDADTPGNASPKRAGKRNTAAAKAPQHRGGGA